MTLNQGSNHRQKNLILLLLLLLLIIIIIIITTTITFIQRCYTLVLCLTKTSRWLIDMN